MASQCQVMPPSDMNLLKMNEFVIYKSCLHLNCIHFSTTFKKDIIFFTCLPMLTGGYHSVRVFSLIYFLSMFFLKKLIVTQIIQKVTHIRVKICVLTLTLNQFRFW